MGKNHNTLLDIPMTMISDRNPRMYYMYQNQNIMWINYPGLNWDV